MIIAIISRLCAIDTFWYRGQYCAFAPADEVLWRCEREKEGNAVIRRNVNTTNHATRGYDEGGLEFSREKLEKLATSVIDQVHRKSIRRWFATSCSNAKLAKRFPAECVRNLRTLIILPL